MMIFVGIFFLLTAIVIGTGVAVVLSIINDLSKRNRTEYKPVTRIPIPTAANRAAGTGENKDSLPAPQIPAAAVTEQKPGTCITETIPKEPVRKERVQAVRKDAKSFQGMAALIIGVIFVVLSGLIFATTTWHTLSSFHKVFMIFGFACVFFAASQLAGTIFKIMKTSQAFYILGSVFLFLTVLAIGYFEQFGDGFTMSELHRYKVLFAGSLATELAIVMGMKKFRDPIYKNACFWGASVSICFFIRAWGISLVDSLKWMAVYSSILVVASELTGRRRAKLSVFVNAELTSFARLHFWIISFFAALFAAAEGLVFIAKHILYGEAVISVLTTLALIMMLAGITVLALKQKEQHLKVLHSLTLTVVFHYLGMSVSADLIYQLLIGTLLNGAWLLASKRRHNPLSAVSGEWVDTAVMIADTLVIMLIAFGNWDSVAELTAAGAVITLLTVIMSRRSREYPVIRAFIPVILYPLTISVRGILLQTDVITVTYSSILLMFLLAVAARDLVKRDRFRNAIMVLGTAAQLVCWLSDRQYPWFAILLSGYLFLKSGQAEGEARVRYEKGGCLYLLAGVFLLSGSQVETFFIRMILVTAVFAMEYIVLCRYRKEASEGLFWEVTGVIVLLFDLAGFYLDFSLAIGYLPVCMMIFAIFYIMLYRSGKIWPHLLAAVAVLPMPAIIEGRYALSEHELYGWIAAFLLVSGYLARRYVPVITRREEEGGKWYFDWFHILAAAVLLPMALAAGDEWRCIYLVMTALYVLQYTAVKPLRESALTTAAALALLAFWIQPFVNYPELLYLEIQLIPAVVFIWCLAWIWNGKKGVGIFQNALYCVCLTVLIIDALIGSNVVDALILEVVCLLIFVWAHGRKQVLWLRISGAVMIGVALYMTKSFWLSLSWWMYLLAAGLGLIVFAARNELKKQEK